MSFDQLVAEDRRLEILRLLAGDPGYSHNDGVIQSALKAMGHAVSRDQLLVDLAWLKDAGLVKTENVGPVAVARLTRRGLDIAHGDAVVPGIKRPGPEG